MKFSPLSITILLTLFLQNNPLAAKTIYQWVDESGKKHYSDRTPTSNNVIEFQGHSLISIDMVRSKSIKISKSGSRKKKSAKRKNRSLTSKSNRCTKIKTKIKSLENKLKRHLVAEKSDQYGEELRNLRWQKIKSC